MNTEDNAVVIFVLVLFFVGLFIAAAFDNPLVIAGEL